MSLFRKEVLSPQRDRLHGEVLIAIPLRWQTLGYFFFVTLCTAAVFLALGSYERIETATGVIVPDKGVAVIVPTRPGVLTEIVVAEGMYVEKDAHLATVRVDEYLPGGTSASSELEDALRQQDASLAQQYQSARAAYEAQEQENTALRAGLAAEIKLIESQIDLQQRVVESSVKAFEALEPQAASGLISGREMQIRREDTLQKQQQLAQLAQTLASRKSALVQAERSAQELRARAQQEAAAVSSSRAQLAQQITNARISREYVLRAPIAGHATAISRRVGQPVSTQEGLMSIIPKNATLRAEVALPTNAIGFVATGQSVRLAIDTFPYQRFGTVAGRVVAVAQSATEMRNSEGRASFQYPVTVEIDEPYVNAFGRQQPLLPGMTLQARITAEKQSFLEWLFEPVFAVRRR